MRRGADAPAKRRREAHAPESAAMLTLSASAGIGEDMRQCLVGVVGGLAAMFAIAACSSSAGNEAPSPTSPSPTEEEGRSLGEICVESGACRADFTCLALPGNNIEFPQCSKGCESDRDCGNGTVCGVAPDGSKMCLNSCDFLAANTVCRDGVPVACAGLDGTHCDACGCPKGQYCREGSGCFPIANEGEPCDEHDACTTANCDKYVGVCRPPVGSACTAANCERCIQQQGFSYCSRECENDEDCPRGKCLGDEFSGVFQCYPLCPDYEPAPCTDGCVEVIAPDPRDSYAYCACKPPTCEVSMAPRGLGAPCTDDSSCIGGRCFGQLSYPVKYCSQDCVADADCGEGMVCLPDASPDCVESTPGACNHCALGCDVEGRCSNHAYCQAVTTVGGESTRACEIYGPAGAPCNDAEQCQSGMCSSLQCL